MEEQQVLDHFKEQIQTAIRLDIVSSMKDAYTFACAYSSGLIRFYNLKISIIQRLYDIAHDQYKMYETNKEAFKVGSILNYGIKEGK